MSRVEEMIRAAEATLGMGERPANTNRITQWYGLNGSPWCFGAGTLVDTPTGFRRIEDLSIGDDVLSGAGRACRILDVSDRISPTLRLKAQGLDSTVVTSEHPYWARQREHRGKTWTTAEPTWVDAGDLKRGDLIAYPLPLDYGCLPQDPHMARLAGRWVGDGWKSVAQRASGTSYERAWLCSAHDEEEEVRKLLTLAGVGAHETRRTTCTQYELYRSDEFMATIDGFGQKAAHKRIPGKVFLWPRDARQAFLDGYASADGWQDPEGGWVIATASRELALGTAKLLRSLGEAPRMQANARKRNQTIQGRDVLCQEQMWAVSWRPLTERSRVQWQRDEAYLWMPVRSVEVAPDQRVFNLSVSGEQTFVADGVAVHNCVMSESFWSVFGGGFTDDGDTCNLASRHGIAPQTTRKGWAYCGYIRQAFQNAGRWSNEPRVGSWFILRGDTHTGMVVGIPSPGVIDTIEGNWTDACVRVRRSTGNISGYCHPPYDDSPSGQPSGTPLLQMGSTGSSVSMLQDLLGQRGHHVDTDGEFGPQTDAAVRAFQTQRGLEADGQVGPQTWEALGVAGQASAPPAPPAPSGPPPAPSGNVPLFPGYMRRGSRGEGVRQLQQRLVDRGWHLGVDGDFGQQTDGRVREYQAEKGLDVDGVVGPITWTSIFSSPIT